MIQIDMNIPKTCDDCSFHIYHSGKNYVCVATPLFYPMNLANYKDGRKDFCPLIEVPQEPRWIPVSERLPEDHKDVLAYLSSGRISICRYNSHKLPFCNNPIGWGYLHENGFIDFKKEHVIAWMPLPEPYEPQESEDEK